MRAWDLAKTLDPLPQRLGLDLEEVDDGLICDLVGAVWCIDHANATRERGSWRQWGLQLCEGLADGRPLEAGVEQLAAAPMGPTFAAWRGAARAVAQLRGAVGWPGQGESDAWLRWVHGRASTGRAHHYGQLLLALTARPSCLWSAEELAARLFARTAEPFDFDTLLRAQLGREDLRPMDVRQTHDVRGLPVARYMAAWLWLQGGEDDLPAADWFARIVRATEHASSIAWHGQLPVQRALWEAEGGFSAVETTGKRIWVSDVIARRRSGDEQAEGLNAPPDAVVAAALAFALNQTADNFAVRVMPSLALWAPFWREVRGWMEAYPDLVAPSGVDERWLCPWRVHDGLGQPWSASRLFLHVCRRVLDELRRPTEIRTLQAEHQVGRRALVALVDRMVQELADTAVARRAQTREGGLRWSGALLTATPEAWDAAV